MASRKPLSMWAITIRENHEPLPIVDRMKSICTEFAEHWCFQLERCPSNGKLHYQCRWSLSEPQTTATLLQVISCRGLDVRDLDIGPESNKSIQQAGLSFYVMKDDTREDGPWHDLSFKPKKRSTYEGRDLLCMDEPRDWQAQILDLISQPPDDRTICWVFNKSGNAGKSKLMKYLRVKGEGVARVPLGTATQIKTSVIEKGEHRTFMVDLPRVRGSEERQTELFSALEEIKNGWVESPMYGKNAELLMEPPHVWIFSNELPNMAHSSLDRWRIYKISDELLLPMSNAEIYEGVAAAIAEARAHRNQQ